MAAEVLVPVEAEMAAEKSLDQQCVASLNSCVPPLYCVVLGSRRPVRATGLPKKPTFQKQQRKRLMSRCHQPDSVPSPSPATTSTVTRVQAHVPQRIKAEVPQGVRLGVSQRGVFTTVRIRWLDGFCLPGENIRFSREEESACRLD